MSASHDHFSICSICSTRISNDSTTKHRRPAALAEASGWGQYMRLTLCVVGDNRHLIAARKCVRSLPKFREKEEGMDDNYFYATLEVKTHAHAQKLWSTLNNAISRATIGESYDPRKGEFPPWIKTWIVDVGYLAPGAE